MAWSTVTNRCHFQTSLAMHSVLFSAVLLQLWPQLLLQNQSLVLVTAMQDNAAPWEMFNCLLHSSGKETPVHSQP